MELKHLIASGKGTFGSVSAVEEPSAFHVEGGTVWEDNYRAFTFK